MKTFVCACEDVTTQDIEHALLQDALTMEDLKRMTGAGTGICQGKMCLTHLARLLLRHGKGSAELLMPPTQRPLRSPVALGLFREP
jgi:bacterioferritin-associated ferredoxin